MSMTGTNVCSHGFSARVMNRVHSRSLLKGFTISYLLTLSSLAITGRLWGKAGFDLLVVAMGWPHVMLGFLFHLNRMLRKGSRQQWILLGLLGLTLAICIVHSLHSLTTLVYLYFVFHAFRDEIFIYHQRRTGHQFSGRVFDPAGRTLLLSAIMVALIGQFVPNDPPQKLLVYMGFCTLVLLLNGLALMGWPAALFELWPGLGYAFPVSLLLLVTMTGMKFLRSKGVVAPLFFTFLVVFHYFSWYVFSLEKIAAAPARPHFAGGIFTGFARSISTRRGFLVIVVALNLFSFVGAYAFQVRHVPSLAYVFDLKYFLYALVFHVTTSMAPKSGPERTLQSELATDSALA